MCYFQLVTTRSLLKSSSSFPPLFLCYLSGIARGVLRQPVGEKGTRGVRDRVWSGHWGGVMPGGLTGEEEAQTGPGPRPGPPGASGRGRGPRGPLPAPSSPKEYMCSN